MVLCEKEELLLRLIMFSLSPVRSDSVSEETAIHGLLGHACPRHRSRCASWRRLTLSRVRT